MVETRIIYIDIYNRHVQEVMNATQRYMAISVSVRNYGNIVLFIKRHCCNKSSNKINFYSANKSKNDLKNNSKH